MIEEIFSMFIGEMSNMNAVLLMIIFVVFVVIAFKLFKTLMKGLMVGGVAAAFPFVAMYFEIPMPDFFLSMGLFERAIWFGVLGIALFLVYSTISGGVGIIKIITWPFRAMFRSSPKKEKKKD